MACDRSSISLTLVHLFHRYAIEGKALAGIWLIGATGCKGLVSLYAGRTVIRFDRKYCRCDVAQTLGTFRETGGNRRRGSD